MHADHAGLLGSTVIAVVLLALALTVVLVRLRGQRDEVFAGVTPGLLPPDPGSAARERVRGGLEWNGPVAVQFTPPDGATPGTIGTVIDGVADQRDVSATILDLAVRGWFRLTEVPTGAAPPEAGATPEPRPPAGRGTSRSDWELTRSPEPPTEALTPFEQLLLERLFAAGPTVRLSGLRGSFGVTMREAQVGLYRDALARGWYRKHPLAKNSILRKVGIGFLVPVLPLSLIWLAVILFGTRDLTTAPLVLGVLGFFLVLAIWGRTRTPRTAEGSAARIQAMGFRRYIETAEARQIRFEEAQAVFSRYLPYAMAFGLASVWAKTFAEVAVLAQNAGYEGLFTDFTWLDLVDVATIGGDLVGDLAGGVADIADLAGSFGDIGDGLSSAFDGLSGAVEGAGDFVSGATGLFDLGGVGDGCDLGGCDVGGCDL